MNRTVEILYFAGVRDIVGLPSERLTLPAAVVTVGDLVGHLEQVRPELSGRLGSVRFAVNETFAAAQDALAEGDVVALIPPVSGG